MEFEEFVQGIKFKFLQPSRPRPKGFRAANMFLRKFGVHLEVANTCLPCDEAELRHRMRAVCRVPRMSTFAVGAIINRAVAELPPGQAYVNVGVWNGFTFLSGLVHNSGKRCIGVDNFCGHGGPRDAFMSRFEKLRGDNHTFHAMDYREYFKSVHREPIGCYFLDGPHTYEHQLVGLQVAERFFADNCIIMVDDTNSEAVRRANLDFIEQSQNRYRMLLDVRTSKNGHPTFWNGQMIFRLDGRNVTSQLRAA